MTITPASIVSEGYNFRSIVDAIERIILLYRPTVPHLYEANYRGVVEALLDLGNILSGIVGSPLQPQSSSVGPVPPGWNTATQSYGSGQTPSDGSYWFDTRQGRLMVAVGGQWYQTNGSESFVHVGSDPPPRQANGLLWFDTRQGKLFTYCDGVAATGEAGWYQTNGSPGKPDLALNELNNVDDSAIVAVPAAQQTSLLMRNGAKVITDPDAYVPVDHLDLGAYGT